MCRHSTSTLASWRATPGYPGRRQPGTEGQRPSAGRVAQPPRARHGHPSRLPATRPGCPPPVPVARHPTVSESGPCRPIDAPTLSELGPCRPTDSPTPSELGSAPHEGRPAPAPTTSSHISTIHTGRVARGMMATISRSDTRRTSARADGAVLARPGHRRQRLRGRRGDGEPAGTVCHPSVSDQKRILSGGGPAARQRPPLSRGAPWSGPTR
jgi:hypothetical protein